MLARVSINTIRPELLGKARRCQRFISRSILTSNSSFPKHHLASSENDVIVQSPHPALHYPNFSIDQYVWKDLSKWSHKPALVSKNGLNFVHGIFEFWLIAGWWDHWTIGQLCAIARSLSSLGRPTAISVSLELWRNYRCLPSQLYRIPHRMSSGLWGWNDRDDRQSNIYCGWAIFLVFFCANCEYFRAIADSISAIRDSQKNSFLFNAW